MLPADTFTVPLGRLHAHALTFDAAVDAVVALCGAGGYIVTPNVDHVMLAEADDDFVDAYRHASLSLVDGMPLVWLARALGTPLPAKISGSDLVRPLAARAARDGLALYLLGGKPGVATRAAAILAQEHPGLVVAGTAAPPLGFERDPSADNDVVDAICAARPAIVLVALGAPKQELWMRDHARALAPAVLVGVGGALDFITGETTRAPRLLSALGLEWLFRLASDPRRLWRRYLVRDRAFFGLAVRALRERAGSAGRTTSSRS